MSDKQLQKVADWEREKELQCARDFQIAQQYAEQQKVKLTTLEQYRMDYLRQTQQNGSSGVTGQHFSQQLNFVGKLDKACEQQAGVHRQSLLVADQRKNQWLKQQQKRKAIETLLEKKARQQQLRELKAEQQLLDEFAIQQHIRR